MRVSRRAWDGNDPRSLAASLRAQTPDPAGIATTVTEIIDRVRSGGDAAVAELSERLDGLVPTVGWSPRIEADRIERAVAEIPNDLRRALEVSVSNATAVAEAQIGSSPSERLVLDAGQRIDIREIAVGSAAIYVPGGRAPYPSSVVMGVVPARVAGVERVVVASPPGSNGLPDPSVLAAASIAGADEVYAVGGAQAIAALAYGTESVPAVDVIAGPGSPWVQEAKLQCSRAVGIDGYAGPSELVVICEQGAPIEWIALDICSQAEHGDDGLLVVISTDDSTLEAIAGSIERLADARESVAEAAVSLVAVEGLEQGIDLANELAPEHLELIADDAEGWAGRLTTAGCLFIGDRSATAFGDYAAGTNHILPTGGAGRFTGPLGPADFRRRISRVEIDEKSARALAETVDVIARSEGFPVHGESALARRNASGEGE